MAGLTPAVIESGAAAGTVASINTAGPNTFKFGGLTFTLGIRGVFASSACSLRMYDSTDEFNWVGLDTADEPFGNNGAGGFVVQYCTQWTPGGRFVNIVAIDAPTGSKGPLAIASFDLQNKTWVPKVSGGPMVEGAGNPSMMLHRLSSGTFVVNYSVQGVVPVNSFLVTYSGAWGVPQQTNDGGGTSVILSVALDATDTIHMLSSSPLIGVVRYRNWNGGAFGGPSSGVAVPSHFNFGLLGVYVAATDELRFPGLNSAAPVEAFILVGTPSAAPLFSVEVVGGDATSIKTGEIPILVLSGSTLTIAWMNRVGSGGVNGLGVMFATSTVGSGIWSAVQFYWNWGANPPQPDPGVDQLEEWLYFDVQGDGSILAAVGTFATGPIQNFCGTLYFLASGSPPPPPSTAVDIALYFEGVLRIPIKPGPAKQNWLQRQITTLRNLLK